MAMLVVLLVWAINGKISISKKSHTLFGVGFFYVEMIVRYDAFSISKSAWCLLNADGKKFGDKKGKPVACLIF